MHLVWSALSQLSLCKLINQPITGNYFIAQNGLYNLIQFLQLKQQTTSARKVYVLHLFRGTVVFTGIRLQGQDSNYCRNTSNDG